MTSEAKTVAGEAVVDGHFAEQNCLNCGTPLIGSHCHACGQQAHLHRSLAAFGHDLLHGVLHFEGKIWTTLPMLAWRPGELTRRYVHGERAKFVSPLAVFLFAVFLMFGVLSIAGSHLEMPEGGNIFEVDVAGDPATTRQALDARLQQMDSEIAAARAKGEDVAQLEQLRNVTANLRAGNGTVALPTGSVATDTLHTGWHRLDEGIKKANENPNLLLYKLQSNAYKFSWMLIFLSVPFVWLLFFWRRDFKIYDHAVFVTYSLSFLTLLCVAATVIGATGVGTGVVTRIYGVILGIIMPVHLYRQLKGAYQLSTGGALARTVLLLFFGVLCMVLFIFILLGLGLTG